MRAFLGHHLIADGYGNATVNISREIALFDPGVSVIDMKVNGTLSRLNRDHWSVDGEAVMLCPPYWLANLTAGAIASYTMYEATVLPEEFVGAINTYAARCIVPCSWCADVFESNGVRVPLQVTPLGIDGSEFRPVDRSDHAGPYTFLWSGTGDRRKGWDIAYRAFMQAFGRDPDVRLILHFRNDLVGAIGFGDPNVKKIVGRLTRRAWLELLGQADCFVFPSRGEGWGLPPREAAATGLPVIVTDHSGLAVDIVEWAIPLRVAGYSPANFTVFGQCGEWAEPDVAQCAELMQWVYLNQAEATRLGDRASFFLREMTPWSVTARGVISALNAIGNREVVMA